MVNWPRIFKCNQSGAGTQNQDGSRASKHCVGRELLGAGPQEVPVRWKVIKLDGGFASPMLSFLVDTGSKKSFLRKGIFEKQILLGKVELELGQKNPC
jgi:hypothetical protein